MSSAIATETSGSFMLNKPAEPAAALARGPVDGLAPLDAIEQRERVVVAAELAQQVARVVVRDAARLGQAASAAARGRRAARSAPSCARRPPGPVPPLRDRRRPRTARARRRGSSWRTTPPARRWRRCRSRSSASSVVRATLAASSAKPEFHAGCPQHVCPRGTSTSHPAARSTFTASTPVSGSKRSTRQVTSNDTRTGRRVSPLGRCGSASRRRPARARRRTC